MSAQRRLKNARKKRTQIASLFDALRHERVTLEQLLQDPPSVLGNVSVNQLMLHTPRLGPEGIKKCLLRARVWPEDKLRTLDAAQRQAIIDCLPPRARKYNVA